MASCPACGAEIPDGTPECLACGIVIAKYRPRSERPPPARHERSPAAVGTAARSATPSSSPLARLGLILLLGGAGGGAVAGAYWYLEIRPRVERIRDPQSMADPRRAGTVEARVDSVAELDRQLDLPGGPNGMVGANGALLLVNREDPWGFLWLRPDGTDRFAIEKQPVIERTYAQTVELWAVTWNGEHYVGYTTGDWFQRRGEYIFTLHDPRDLRVTRTYAAPAHLGCVEWDGDGYWAATRRNTRDAEEPAYLYRLDADFRVIATYDPPGVGCQGMAWDGRHLWWADVFSDHLYVLDTSRGSPQVLHSQPLRLGYLSGVAHFDGHIWVSEYKENRLHRLNPRFVNAWTSPTPGGPSARPATVERRAPAGPRPEGEEIAKLRRQLRSPDRHRRDAAEMELRRAGIAVDYDRYEDPFAPAEVGAEEIAIDDWAIELRGDSLYGWWRLRFGDGLFESERRIEALGPVNLPLFARYTVNVEGGTLSRPLERTFDAQPGENRMERVELASGLGGGRYSAYLFVHVQYVTREGTGQIFNQSSMQLEVER